MNYARIVAKHRPALINFAALEHMPLDKRLDTIFTIFEEKLDLFVLVASTKQPSSTNNNNNNKQSSNT